MKKGVAKYSEFSIIVGLVARFPHNRPLPGILYSPTLPVKSKEKRLTIKDLTITLCLY